MTDTKGDEREDNERHDSADIFDEEEHKNFVHGWKLIFFDCDFVLHFCIKFDSIYYFKVKPSVAFKQHIVGWSVSCLIVHSLIMHSQVTDEDRKYLTPSTEDEAKDENPIPDNEQRYSISGT